MGGASAHHSSLHLSLPADGGAREARASSSPALTSLSRTDGRRKGGSRFNARALQPSPLSPGRTGGARATLASTPVYSSPDHFLLLSRGTRGRKGDLRSSAHRSSPARRFLPLLPWAHGGRRASPGKARKRIKVRGHPLLKSITT